MYPLVSLPGVLAGEVSRGVGGRVRDTEPVVLKHKIEDNLLCKGDIWDQRRGYFFSLSSPPGPPWAFLGEISTGGFFVNLFDSIN